MNKEGIIDCKDDFITREAFNSEVGEVFYLNAPKVVYLFLLLITVRL